MFIYNNIDLSSLQFHHPSFNTQHMRYHTLSRDHAAQPRTFHGSQILMAHCIEGRIFRKIKTLLNRHLRSVESDKSYQLRLKILFLVAKKYVAALNIYIYIYTHSGYTCVYIIYILYIHISSPVCKTHTYHTCPMHIYAYALYHIDLVTLMDGDNDTNTACHRCPTLGPQTL